MNTNGSEELHFIRCRDCELLYEVTWIGDGDGPPTEVCPRCGSDDLDVPGEEVERDTEPAGEATVEGSPHPEQPEGLKGASASPRWTEEEYRERLERLHCAGKKIFGKT